MSERIRVLLLIPHLGGGGAEQVTALLARGLSREKYEIHLALVTEGRYGPGAIPRWVTVHALGARRVRSGAFRLLRLIRELRPGVILSGMAHLNFLVLLMRPLIPRGTHVLVRQNATVSAVLAAAELPLYTRFLYRSLYRHADRVICQSRAMAEDLIGELHLSPELVAVLPNPVDLEGILAARRAASRWIGPGPHLLAVGRLAPEKGFDMLIAALAAVRVRFSDADLTIAGAGAERSNLEALCAAYGVTSAVRFAGQVDCPYVFYPGASLFVLSSRYEGMPNALLEAAAGDLPLVALPCSGGVRDLLHGQPGAWLAGEVSAPALAATLLEALASLRPGQRFTHAFIGAGPPPDRSANQTNFSLPLHRPRPTE